MKVFGSIAVTVAVVAAFIIMGKGADVPADTTPASAPSVQTVQSTASNASEPECVDPVTCPPREGCVPKVKSRCGTEEPVGKKQCGDAPVAKAKGDCADVVDDCEPSDCTPEELEACKKPQKAVVADR